MAIKFYEVIKLGSENKHLPVPLILGEIVQEIPDEELEKEYGKTYKKIFHNRGKSTGIFYSNKFKRCIHKSKGELKILIKMKGKLPKAK